MQRERQAVEVYRRGIAAEPGAYETFTDGVLAIWDTAPLPEGTHTLRLVGVNHTGSFPPPYITQVTVVR